MRGSILGMRRLFTAVAICVATCGVAGSARADDAPADRVTDLKRAGDDLLVDGHPIDALKYYDEALALRRDPAILYNRGRANNALARYPQALADFESFEREAPPDLLARVPALKEFLTIVRSRVATVHVECDVAGASVRVGAEELGTTPLARDIVLNAGTVTLAIEKDGYFPFKKTLDVPGGGKSLVTAHLIGRASVGVVTVISNVPNAEVRVDGTSAGMVPTELMVAPGQHRVDVTRDGYRASSRTILVRAGETQEIAMTLEPERSILAQWWFWTAVGVVAVGGSLTVVALTTERPLSEGSIEPGNLRSGFRF